jgi:hypothetical protein
VASPVAETSDTFQLTNFSTNGITRTRVLNIIPGPVLVRVGLTRVAATDAAIGIAEVSRAGTRRTETFGAHPDWPPQIGIASFGQVIIGGHVQRGIMKAWFLVQAWA